MQQTEKNERKVNATELVDRRKDAEKSLEAHELWESLEAHELWESLGECEELGVCGGRMQCFHGDCIGTIRKRPPDECIVCGLASRLVTVSNPPPERNSQKISNSLKESTSLSVARAV